MEGIVLTVLVPLLISVYLLLLCTGKKKRKEVEIVQHVYATPLGDSGKSEASKTPDSQSQSLHANNGSEKRRSHTTSQTSQSRVLPAPPSSGEEKNRSRSASQRNSTNGTVELAADTPGRKLPPPPPEIMTRINKENDLQDDKDKYARVDSEPEKVESVCIEITSPDGNEGNGKPSHYAKVASETEGNKANVSSLLSSPSAKYPTPEYATIDKLKKGAILNVNKPASDEPPAPPIPERNFDPDDELEDEGEEPDESESTIDEVTTKAPVYDKVCVRESLEHIRLRQEVEEERRLRYANLPSIDGVDCGSGDVYEQIDETDPEVVYETVNQPDCAGRTFQPNNAGYSSIGDVIAPGHADAARLPSNPSTKLQTRPDVEHHYEQIERESNS